MPDINVPESDFTNEKFYQAGDGSRIPLSAEHGNAYETVAASQTSQVMGTTGAKGDYLDGVLIVPATSAAGAVSITDGSTVISVFAGGGTTALVDLKPFYVKLKLRSASGAWKVTTGTNVSAIGVGRFS